MLVFTFKQACSEFVLMLKYFAYSNYLALATLLHYIIIIIFLKEGKVNITWSLSGADSTSSRPHHKLRPPLAARTSPSSYYVRRRRYVVHRQDGSVGRRRIRRCAWCGAFRTDAEEYHRAEISEVDICWRKGRCGQNDVQVGGRKLSISRPVSWVTGYRRC